MSKIVEIANYIEPNYVRAFHVFETDGGNHEFAVEISAQSDYFIVWGEFHEIALIASLFIAMLNEKKSNESVRFLDWDVWRWWKDKCSNLTLVVLSIIKWNGKKCKNGNGAIKFHAVICIKFLEHVCHTCITNVKEDICWGAKFDWPQNTTCQKCSNCKTSLIIGNPI